MYNQIVSAASRLLVVGGAAAFAIGVMWQSPLLAQNQGGGGPPPQAGGHQPGMHDEGCADVGGCAHDEGAIHEGQQGGRKGIGGRGSGAAGGPGSLRDIFRQMEDEFAEEPGRPEAKGGPQAGQAGVGAKPSEPPRGSAVGQGGPKGGPQAPPAAVAEEDEESDRPPWAGIPGSEGKPGRPNVAAGTKKGDVYGDMWVILRNPDGTPIYIEVDVEGETVLAVQPLDAEGNVIPYLDDGSGELSDPDAVVEVDLARFNVGRAGLRVLSVRLADVVNAINDESVVKVALDETGRLVMLGDDPATEAVEDDFVIKTVDSPLENLALYIEILHDGTLTAWDVDTSKFIYDGSLVANLVDDGWTDPTDPTAVSPDYLSAIAFFAAASDKTLPITVDSVTYMNAILGLGSGELEDPIVGVLTDELDKVYLDYTSYSYDRSDTWDGVEVTVLVETSPGTWEEVPVNVYEAVFASVDAAAADVAGFALAADDSRTVIEFLHEYSIPAETTTF